MENFINYSNDVNISTTTTTTELSTEIGVADDKRQHGIILFILAAVAIGALVRHLLKHTPFPYTIILIIVGLITGFLVQIPTLSTLVNYSAIADLEPHFLLLLFLPALIFESAFVVDIHIFKKTLAQSMLLAGPGIMFNIFFTALIARYLFDYNWSWITSLMFGALLSATDPVSVVALFKEQGTCVRLSTLVEGESLLNNGVAFVLFNVFLSELTPGEERSGLEIATYLIQVVLISPILGYVMARISILWLSYVYNDAVVEITITLASTYVTYYVAEEFLKVSGVLSMVVFGIEINKRRTNISPQVDAFLHKFWNMLSYLVNTLIFMRVGLVIAVRAFSGVEDTDWIFLIALYLGVSVIRLAMVYGLAPILVRIGYDLNRKSLLVIVWGGLRGAVSLSLALVVDQTQGISDKSIGSKVLFHTAGIVLLTLMVNGTTLSYLLKCLGLSEISRARRLTFLTAVRHIEDTKLKAITLLKSDKFLVDAHWGLIADRTIIDLPFNYLEEDDIDVEGMTSSNMPGHQCNSCKEEMSHALHPKEVAELIEDLHTKIIRAEKTSYWKQYNNGILDQEAVLILNNLADDVMDIPDRLLEVKDIECFWKIPKYLLLLHQWMERVLSYKFMKFYPPPKYAFNRVAYKIVTRPIKELIIFFIITIDIVITATELSISDLEAIEVLTYCNFVLVSLYMTEVILKLIGLRLYFFKSLWNWFDIFVLIISWIDVYLTVSTTGVSSATLRAIRIPRILRVLRVLKLVKIAMPVLIKLLENYVSHYLRFGYGIGKAFVLGEEDVLKQFDNLQFIVDEEISKVMKRRVEKSRLDVLRSLYMMQREFPEIVLTVKTHQAIGVVLNHCSDSIKQLKDGGIIDEMDTTKLLRPIEVKMKRLKRWNHGRLMPTEPTTVLFTHPWLSGLDEHILYAIIDLAYLIKKEPGEVLLKYNSWTKHLLIVVSGLVKMITFTEEDENSPSKLYTPQPLINLINSSIPSSTLVHPPCSEHLSSTTPFAPAPPPLMSHALSSLLSSLEMTSHDDDQMDFNKLQIQCVEFLGVGTVLGDAELLKKQRTNYLVTCETGVDAFSLEHSELEKLMLQYPVLEERLWRICGVSVATMLLKDIMEYKDVPHNQLLLMLYESSIMIPSPEGTHLHLEIMNDWKQVVVVSGEASCLETKQKFIGPCIVPNRIRSLLMTGDVKILAVYATTNFGLSSITPIVPKIPEFNLMSREWLLHFKAFFWLVLMKLWSALTYLYTQLCQSNIAVSHYSLFYDGDKKTDSSFTYMYKQSISLEQDSSCEVARGSKSLNPNLLSTPTHSPLHHHDFSSTSNIPDELQTASSTSSTTNSGNNIDICKKSPLSPVVSTDASNSTIITGTTVATTSAAIVTGVTTTTTTTAATSTFVATVTDANTFKTTATSATSVTGVTTTTTTAGAASTFAATITEANSITSTSSTSAAIVTDAIAVSTTADSISAVYITGATTTATGADVNSERSPTAHTINDDENLKKHSKVWFLQSPNGTDEEH